MRVLVDTHALVWWWRRDPRLPQQAHDTIADPDIQVVVSAAVVWEMSIKHHSGKWAETGELLGGLEQRIARSGFSELPISLVHAHAAGALPGPHKDPFDRMLIAQAQSEGARVVTADAVFRAYGVSVIWR